MATSGHNFTLNSHTTLPRLPPPLTPLKSKSYTYYHAGPLFTAGDLSTNSALASRISALSYSKYIPIVPQNLEQRDTSPHAIRDSDIRALLSCDLALFVYDGAELDSGTVVEYLFAKFADIPAVILRTDFRGAGDQAGHEGGDAWNLMSSFYPRTERVVVDSMMVYKEGLGKALEKGKTGGEEGVEAGRYVVEKTAQGVVEAFAKVIQTPSVMPKEMRKNVFSWLALMPGLKDGSGKENTEEMMKLLKKKEEKDLL